MWELIAFVAGIALGYWGQSHFKNSIEALKADLKKELESLRSKM